MIIHIVAGGPVKMIPSFTQYNENDVTWIGVDRGLLTLLKQGVIPAKGIGDFDSVSHSELEWIKEKYSQLDIVPAEKDQTDTELAIDWAIAQNPEKILVFGATGGRLDHALANIQLLMKGITQEVVIEIIDTQNVLSLVSPGNYNIEKTKCYSYISFLPFTKVVKGMTLTGFKYPLKNRNIEWGTTLCISNEIIEERGTFSFSDGIVIMVKSKDLSPDLKV